eukprot:3219830-Rhodomonas_salina.1
MGDARGELAVGVQVIECGLVALPLHGEALGEVPLGTELGQFGVADERVHAVKDDRFTAEDVEDVDVDGLLGRAGVVDDVPTGKAGVAWGVVGEVDAGQALPGHPDRGVQGEEHKGLLGALVAYLVRGEVAEDGFDEGLGLRECCVDVGRARLELLQARAEFRDVP